MLVVGVLNFNFVIQKAHFIDNEIGDAMVRNEILKNHLSFNEIKDLHEFSNKLNLKFGMSFLGKKT